MEPRYEPIEGGDGCCGWLILIGIGLAVICLIYSAVMALSVPWRFVCCLGIGELVFLITTYIYDKNSFARKICRPRTLTAYWHTDKELGKYARELDREIKSLRLLKGLTSEAGNTACISDRIEELQNEGELIRQICEYLGYDAERYFASRNNSTERNSGQEDFVRASELLAVSAFPGKEKMIRQLEEHIARLRVTGRMDEAVRLMDKGREKQALEILETLPPTYEGDQNIDACRRIIKEKRYYLRMRLISLAVFIVLSAGCYYTSDYVIRSRPASYSEQNEDTAEYSGSDYYGANDEEGTAEYNYSESYEEDRQDADEAYNRGYEDGLADGENHDSSLYDDYDDDRDEYDDSDLHEDSDMW